jgi:hypothetical protein
VNQTLPPPVPGEDFVVRYEQLRNDALSRSHGADGGFGLTLFLRQGMTAWMRTSSYAVTPPARESAQPGNAVSPLPCDVRSQAAVILAGIILSHPPETTLCQATCRS